MVLAVVARASGGGAGDMGVNPTPLAGRKDGMWGTGATGEIGSADGREIGFTIRGLRPPLPLFPEPWPVAAAFCTARNAVDITKYIIENNHILNEGELYTIYNSDDMIG